MFVLSEHSSIANQYISQLRDVQRQKDRAHFRNNLEKLGEILAYELSKTLTYRSAEVATPIGTAKGFLLDEDIVLATVLRAGLPFYQGILRLFEDADSAFVGAYRKEGGEELAIEANYVAAPDLNGKVLIIADPMLATGKSLVETVRLLHQNGMPKQLHIVVAIASKPGIAYLKEHLSDFSLWVGTIDEKLNQKAYIVPGLGDAGDLSFGKKL